MNPFCKILFVVLAMFLLSFAITRAQQGSPETEKSSCICFEIYEPICGTNNQTYANSCFLKCAQRKDPYLFGLCQGECPCCQKPYYNAPISNDICNTGWGWGLYTTTPEAPQGPYKNAKEVEKVSPENSCLCYGNYEPVCATNNQTYGNPCQLNCERKKDPYLFGLCYGECPCCKEAFYNDPTDNKICQAGAGWGWGLKENPSNLP